MIPAIIARATVGSMTVDADDEDDDSSLLPSSWMMSIIIPLV